MTVNIEWRRTNGGSAATEVDHGAGGNGDTLGEQEVFITHDGSNAITGCKFWMGEKSGSYTGDFAAATDLAEMIGWGDGGSAAAFGGYQVSMDDGVSWPTYLVKAAADYSAFYTSQGQDSDSGVVLSSSMNSTPAMTGNSIPTGCSTWPHFKSRVQIPTNETATGVRQFDLKLRFTYTS